MATDSSRPSLDELARELVDAVPRNFKALGDDLERNFRSLLQAGLGKMDLVTREEFDLQVAVLARTREKLEALETRLAELEDRSAD
jgi:BMFP domain-containing protein YqiC